MDAARLIGQGSGSQHTLTLGKDACIIGSAPGNDLVIGDNSVSRSHARIERSTAGYRLIDISSTNGTFVNGRRISAPTLLADGDEVRFGRVTFRLSVDAHATTAPVGESERSAVTSAVTAERGKRATAATQPVARTPRRPMSPTKAALATVVFVVAGFLVTILFLNWDQIEDALEVGEPAQPRSVASIAPRDASPNGAVVATPAALSAPETPPAPGAPKPASQSDAQVAAWLGPLNFYRALSGVGDAQADPALSAANQAHTDYLYSNYGDRIFAVGGDVHREDPKRPGYSDAGAKAAASSSIGARGCDHGIPPPPADAITGWIRTPFHRLWLLNPGLHGVGYGQHCDSSVCIEALNTGTDIDPMMSAPTPFKAPVEFPPEDSTLKLRSAESEWPDPLKACPDYALPTGLAITLQLGSQVVPKLTAYSLTRNNGSAPGPVEACGFNADSYTNPDPTQLSLVRDVLRGFGAIVMIPRKPLEPGKYTASISAGQIYTWNFTID